MNKGFSLVELIVVIAIMAILVGVAVPVYTSYISKAQDASDVKMLDTLNNACEIVNVEYDVSIAYTKNGAEVTATITGNDKDEAMEQLNSILGNDYAVNVTNYTVKITLNSEPVAYTATPADGDVVLPKNIA
jgi:prepilin-type N-terminal cleavage/methylation domain-containing protein